MKYLFYLGHPAHFHLFRHTIDELQTRHRVKVLWRAKDVLPDLLHGVDWDREVVQPRDRGGGTVAIGWGLMKREWRLLRVCLRERPDVLVGCSPELAHVGRLLGLRSVITVEDDYDVIPRLARLTYPFCTEIVVPEGCDVGPHQAKAVTYRGYHELAYLHPRRFTPEVGRVADLRRGAEAYAVVRLSGLAAHHDSGIRGLDDGDVEAVVAKLSATGSVWISSERPLPERFASMRLPTLAAEIHHVLAGARILVTDSQTMALEAAVLGTPSVRYSDFVGRISVLDGLETSYGLTIGVTPDDREALLAAIDAMSRRADRQDWPSRRTRMLADTIDVSAFLIRHLEDPASPPGRSP